MLLVYDESGRLLLEQRPAAGLWGGLWGLPQCDDEVSVAGWCQQWLGGLELSRVVWPARRHTFSHFHLVITPELVQVKSRPAWVMDGVERVWYNIHKPDKRGFAAPISRLVKELELYLEGENR